MNLIHKYDDLVHYMRVTFLQYDADGNYLGQLVDDVQADYISEAEHIVHSMHDNIRILNCKGHWVKKDDAPPVATLPQHDECLKITEINPMSCQRPTTKTVSVGSQNHKQKESGGYVFKY